MVTPIKLPLTSQQESTLHFILEFINQYEYPPTIVEIQEKMGYKNPGHVHKILHYLERKGYITRKKREHRSIRLTALSEEIITTSQPVLNKRYSE